MKNWNPYGMLRYIIQPIEKRRVNFTKVVDVDVSTVAISDIATYNYETAVRTRGQTYPVARYVTLAEAEQGHNYWVEYVKTHDSVIRLGTGDGEIEDEEFPIR